jgi:hypothetical protein
VNYDGAIVTQIRAKGERVMEILCRPRATEGAGTAFAHKLFSLASDFTYGGKAWREAQME